MNPQSATMPTPAPMAPTPAPVSSGPSIVTSIPVHTQQAAPAPPGEDAELDQIMHDVNRELKKEDDKPVNHGLLGFLHHDPKPLVKVNNQPKQPALATPVAVQSAPSVALPVAVATPAPAAAIPQAQPQLAPQPKAVSKSKAERHIPVFVIFVALCVTGFLIAAAIAAYRQQAS